MSFATHFVKVFLSKNKEKKSITFASLRQISTTIFQLSYDHAKTIKIASNEKFPIIKINKYLI